MLHDNVCQCSLEAMSRLSKIHHIKFSFNGVLKLLIDNHVTQSKLFHKDAKNISSGC